MLDPTNFDTLTTAELSTLVSGLEAQFYDRAAEDILKFAESLEIPGTPPALTDEQRTRVGRRKKGEDVVEEVDEDTPDLYAKRIELARHHKLILHSVQDMMEDVPFEGVLDGKETAVAPEGIIFMTPPGAAKSTMASVIAPAFIMGRWPRTDVICASYAAELAKRFGRRVRSVVRDPNFEKIHKCHLNADNTAVDQWSLSNGSSYRAVGIMGGVTGFRADIILADDLLAGREEADSEVIREKIYQALIDDLFTRLKPGGKILLIGTRWHEADPIGRLLGESWKGESGLRRGTDGRIWYVVNLPMLPEHDDDLLGRPAGGGMDHRLWPEWFTVRHVEIAMKSGERGWSSLYQQRPSGGEGNILLKEYWRCWPHGDPKPTDKQERDFRAVRPPKVHFTVLSYDTAFEEDEEADYSAMTAWGFFEHTSTLESLRQKPQEHMILLGAWKKKVQAVELVEIVKDHVQLFRPDLILVEKRASGIQLVQELQRRRWPVQAWLPPGPPGAKGKVPRAWQASYAAEQGTVWFMPGPRTLEVIEQCASFPRGRNDDLVDTVTCAIIWARNRSFLDIPTDALDEAEEAELERDEYKSFGSEGRRLYGGGRVMGGATPGKPDGTKRRGYG